MIGKRATVGALAVTLFGLTQVAFAQSMLESHSTQPSPLIQPTQPTDPTRPTDRKRPMKGSTKPTPDQGDPLPKDSVSLLTVTPEKIELIPGVTGVFSVNAFFTDRSRQTVTAHVDCVSADTSVATCNPSNAGITGNRLGTTQITFSYGGKQATVPVTVFDHAAAGLSAQALQGAVDLQVAPGETKRVPSIKAVMSDGSIRDVTAWVDCRSSDTQLVECKQTGGLWVVGKGSGFEQNRRSVRATLTYSYGGASASAVVTVLPYSQLGN